MSNGMNNTIARDKSPSKLTDLVSCKKKIYKASSLDFWSSGSKCTGMHSPHALTVDVKATLYFAHFAYFCVCVYRHTVLTFILLDMLVWKAPESLCFIVCILTLNKAFEHWWCKQINPSCLKFNYIWKRRLLSGADTEFCSKGNFLLLCTVVFKIFIMTSKMQIWKNNIHSWYLDCCFCDLP